MKAAEFARSQLFATALHSCNRLKYAQKQPRLTSITTLSDDTAGSYESGKLVHWLNSAAVARSAGTAFRFVRPTDSARMLSPDDAPGLLRTDHCLSCNKVMRACSVTITYLCHSFICKTSRCVGIDQSILTTEWGQPNRAGTCNRRLPPTRVLPVTQLRNRHYTRISDSRRRPNQPVIMDHPFCLTGLHAGTSSVKICVITMRCHDSPVAGSIVGAREFFA